MAALDNFKNCYNLTVEQTEVIALVRGVSGAVCCARAGGKGTAGTAMAVPVFEEEKMASLGF